MKNRKNRSKSQRPERDNAKRQKVEPEQKAQIVALWCLLCRWRKCAYPFHFISFCSDLSFFCEGPVSVPDVLDVWQAAVQKLDQSEGRQQYPGELTQKEVDLILARDNIADWRNLEKAKLLAAILLLALRRQSKVGGMHFKNSLGRSGRTPLFDQFYFEVRERHYLEALRDFK